MVAFSFTGDTLVRKGALKNFCHLAETAFLGEREQSFAGTIWKVDVGTCVDKGFECGDVTLAAVTQHNRFDQRGSSEIVGVIKRRLGGNEMRTTSS